MLILLMIILNQMFIQYYFLNFTKVIIYLHYSPTRSPVVHSVGLGPECHLLLVLSGSVT